MTLDPQDSGAPDYASRYWDPLWAACSDLNMPAHFHIASSLTANAFYGIYFCASHHQKLNPAIVGGMHLSNNARMGIDRVYRGSFDWHPKLKFVAGESGVDCSPYV